MVIFVGTKHSITIVQISRKTKHLQIKVVGLAGLEPATTPLWAVRSNQTELQTLSVKRSYCIIILLSHVLPSWVQHNNPSSLFIDCNITALFATMKWKLLSNVYWCRNLRIVNLYNIGLAESNDYLILAWYIGISKLGEILQNLLTKPCYWLLRANLLELTPIFEDYSKLQIEKII